MEDLYNAHDYAEKGTMSAGTLRNGMFGLAWNFHFDFPAGR